MIHVHYKDNLELELPEKSVDLIYIDPPFNTGSTQKLRKYSYADTFVNYASFMRPRLEMARRVLKDTGSIFVHVDHHESHHTRFLLEALFDYFRNEIIWAYDFGARQKSIWPTKHDNIFWYTVSDSYTFNYEAMDRIPYMSPNLFDKDPSVAALGKTPTDVWWHTIVPTNGKERTGYPTQKPKTILRRIISVHSNPGDTVFDFFAGSGTTGEVAASLGRESILVDNNPQAIEVMKKRFEGFQVTYY